MYNKFGRLGYISEITAEGCQRAALLSTVCFCNVPCIEQTFTKKYNAPIIQVKGGTVMSFFSRRDGFAGHRKQKLYRTDCAGGC